MRGHRRGRYVPPPSAIPLATLVPPPTPFAPADDGAGECPFVLRHVRAATEPAFVADGEWVGYYAHANSARVDPAMRRVRFYARAAAEATHLHADDAIDDFGRFHLRGEICRTSGRLRMRKEYDAGFGWDWAGLATPFGMIGTWGSSYWGQENLGGWFWLWKKAWSEPWPESV